MSSLDPQLWITLELLLYLPISGQLYRLSLCLRKLSRLKCCRPAYLTAILVRLSSPLLYLVSVKLVIFHFKLVLLTFAF